ncbi:NPCBM/NEW2 domain-containing protein [Emticicia sp. 21SJ11W-3]|uniref:NPCBM/NEW2 domain-containing protein n=1 Tax=Emticicia sp. 21SJ11W-3 TaxID=2916755 RepID=UPI00209CE8B7|nr:NPCBM/NEW2 domain-containing protein [Emticicia sp. 21SJ11W-3]UTA66839.1 NPCBM/NEW2 domain-containing protein [Emticicia sp. 21SJ11W-3]
MNRKLALLVWLAMLATSTIAQNTKPLWLDDLPIKSYSEGIPAVLPKTNAAGDQMKIAGKTFSHGVGVSSTSVLSFQLAGHAASFSAMVGVDDLGIKNLPHRFYVIGDKQILFDSGEMRWGDAPKPVNVNLAGIQRLGLLVLVDIYINRTFTNWADAAFVMKDNFIPATIPNQQQRYILTPQPDKKPRINSAGVFGARPGNPFLYTIAATGQRPVTYSVQNLPKGLSVDTQTGIISGKVMQKGTYTANLKVRNAFGEAQKKLTITIGDTIALTPPIGWNGWNSWAKNIDQQKVKASADAMVKMGLNQHGWTYINIDDAWQGQRGGALNAIQPNEKFPEFRKMVDYIHSLGLKVGVYSTPMITSYAGYIGGSSDYPHGRITDSIKNNKRAFRYIGKYTFEENDARQMAEWGIDYLKYDWRIDVKAAEKMSVALRNSGRDIVYSISNSAPFAYAKDWARLTNSFRTGPDIRDSWLSLYHSAFTLDKWAPYGGRGHWLDPDMMILGNVTTGSALHPTRLTPDEQYSHVSLFSLLSAPLLIGCPIEQLDAFTLNLLTNDEVIEINQDPAGKPARLVKEENGVQTWVKPLADGSYAIGLFNIAYYGQTPQSYFRWDDEKAIHYNLDLKALGLQGRYQLRDVWRQKNLGVFSGVYPCTIQHHGVVMLRISPVK